MDKRRRYDPHARDWNAARVVERANDTAYLIAFAGLWFTMIVMAVATLMGA